MDFCLEGLSQEYHPVDGQVQTKEPSNGAGFQLSGGEIHYLYWFIQGSIMVPHIRQRLRRAWGFCDRHAWGYLLVEAAFYRGYMHGASLLYEDLLFRALSVFNLGDPFKYWRLQRRLERKGPCPMCEMGFGPHSKGVARAYIIETGRSASELYVLAHSTQQYWEGTICGRCMGDGSVQRCRPHLIQDISFGLIKELSIHKRLVNYIYDHIRLYHRSFRLEYQGSGTIEDMAALISAVGWCSGWKTFLSIFSKENFFKRDDFKKNR